MTDEWTDDDAMCIQLARCVVNVEKSVRAKGEARFVARALREVRLI